MDLAGGAHETSATFPITRFLGKRQGTQPAVKTDKIAPAVLHVSEKYLRGRRRGLDRGAPGLVPAGPFQRVSAPGRETILSVDERDARKSALAALLPRSFRRP